MTSPESSVADWASLPPNVCQKILSTYEETLRDGAGVCKAWNSVANADGLGPVNLNVHCEYKEDEETAADWINSKLAKFVTPHLKVLTVTYEGILGNPDVMHPCLESWDTRDHLCAHKCTLAYLG